jgi:hypothetical protein
MALDPDIGTTAANDVSGYDAARGLVYVSDGSGAVGYLLRDASGNALRVVRQYGVGNFAPAIPSDAATAQQSVGVHLMSGPRDVQLLLSAVAGTGAASYDFVLLRGATIADVQRLADLVMAKLGPSGTNP